MSDCRLLDIVSLPPQYNHIKLGDCLVRCSQPVPPALPLQSPAVIHFDLKPDNLLLAGEGENLLVKVADFG